MTMRIHGGRLSLWLLAGLLWPGAAGALPLISEILYDAAGSDDGHVFVELYGTPGEALDGLVLEGINGANGEAGPAIALSGMFPGDGLFVLADRTGGGVTFVAEADLLANFDFQNGPDSVVLRRDGVVLDALGYGTFAAGEVFAGEFAPAPDAAPGESLARHFANADSGDNAADFGVLSSPTPGSAPIQSVPEPALAWLLAAAAARVWRRG